MKQIREVHGLLWAWAAFCCVLYADDQDYIPYLWQIGLYSGILGLAIGSLWHSKLYIPRTSWHERPTEHTPKTPSDKE